MDPDYILCECQLAPLEAFVTFHEQYFDVSIAKPPAICMTMIQAEDSVELQPFYLGEAITTECQLIVNGQIGYGLCIGDEPVRSYCIAFFDAVSQLQNVDKAPFDRFLAEQFYLVEQAKKLEYNQILRTKVDFKIMDQD
jgi:alpha-D-ribose 1-methylphosphonate 5-triphosphate synthase subunit PhnG